MDTPGDKILEERTSLILATVNEARTKISKSDVVYFGSRPKTAGMLFNNYANMIKNRNIDLFDDAIFLLESGRVPSACIIARCVMETHAIGMHAYDEIERSFLKTGVEGLADKVLRFINSSRFKVEEQKSFKKGNFALSDYHFTDEAKSRMASEAARSVHVLNAMRLLFELELKQSGQKESSFELTYNGLSEWVHPSQTSLFHRYAVASHRIETSIGAVSMQSRIKNECAEGLKLIEFSENLHRDMVSFGEIIHLAEINSIV